CARATVLMAGWYRFTQLGSSLQCAPLFLTTTQDWVFTSVVSAATGNAQHAAATTMAQRTAQAVGFIWIPLCRMNSGRRTPVRPPDAVISHLRLRQRGLSTSLQHEALCGPVQREQQHRPGHGIHEAGAWRRLQGAHPALYHVQHGQRRDDDGDL